MVKEFHECDEYNPEEGLSSTEGASLSDLLCEVTLSGNYFEDCNLLISKVDKLQQFAKNFAQCPCCGQVKECTDDCEYRHGGNEFMELARNAIYT